jgi:hypothetical protein
MSAFPPSIRSAQCILVGLLSLVATKAPLAQQTDVPFYNVYTGFGDIYSHSYGLNQPGFHLQAGANLRSWLSAGFDYTVASGSETLHTNQLTPVLQQEIGGVIQEFIAAGVIPANYKLAVPTDAFTQTFTIGGEYTYRHFQKTTLFARPSLAALREVATPHPYDEVSTLIVQGLAPSGHVLDWVGAYGFGGGADFLFTRHLALRTQLDAIYNHPFSNILEGGRWSVRFSVGPSFSFGRNILTAHH